MFHLLRFLHLALLMGTGACIARGDGADSFMLDLPCAANMATPSWLGHPVTGTGPFAAIELPITPPDATASLLITVFFQEQNGGFLRIGWQAATAVLPESGQELPGPGEAALSSVLCENFYEGIGMSNQRKLLIPAEAMKQAGSLSFQTGSTNLGITRIQMEWLENSIGLSSPAVTDVEVTAADGHTTPAAELSGQPPLAEDPSWHGRLVNVPVTDAPLRIEQGLDFTVQIDSVPSLARVALEEAGLPWGQHLVVWVNNQRAGMVVPATPPLDNGGYKMTPTNAYVGWREGTFLVPTTALLAGADTIEFSAEPDVVPTTPADPNAPAVPLAVKDVVLQLAYPDVAPVVTAGPTPASAPSSASAPSADSTTGAAAATTTVISTSDSTSAPAPVTAATTSSTNP